MKPLIIRYIDPVYCRLSKADFKQVESVFEYDYQIWKEGPFRKESISKKGYFYDKKFQEFLTGLLPRLERYCELNGIEVHKYNFPPENPKKTIPPSLPNINLREDQLKILNKIYEQQRGVIKSPTGTGKTVLAGALISSYPGAKVIFVVHTVSLLTQTKEAFSEWFGEENVGIIGNSVFDPQRITILMAQTAHNILKKKETAHPDFEKLFDVIKPADIIIVDESHHITEKGGRYSDIFISCSSPIRIGFTATPYKTKKEALTCEGFLGPIIAELGMNEGFKKGIIVKPKVKLVSVPYNFHINNDPVIVIEKDNDGRLIKKERRRTFKDIYLEGIVKNKVRNRLVAKEAANQVRAGKTVLIMITDVENNQGFQIKEILHDIYEIESEFVCGSTENQTREDVKRTLQAGEIKCVIATAIWREGVNIPSLGCVINACGGKSEIMTLQAIGRGLRTSEGKENIILIDFLDPYRYLSQHTVERLKIYTDNGWL